MESTEEVQVEALDDSDYNGDKTQRFIEAKSRATTIKIVLGSNSKKK